MTGFPIDNPAEVDRLLAGGDLDALLNGLEVGTPLGLARLGQVALATGEVPLMTQALIWMTDIPGALTRGVRMLLQAQLGDYAAVLKEDSHPKGSHPLELEDAAHAAAATAVAYTQLGDFDLALCHLSVAIALAHASGLKNRLGMLELERERLLSLRGRARPEELGRLLLLPMSDRRRAWGRRTWAEALMSLGDYQAALRVLGHVSIDTAADTALRAFLHALLGLPAVPVDRDDLLIQPYGRMALVLEHPDEAGWKSLHTIEGEPQATYARLIEAMTLSTTPEMCTHAVRVIGERPSSRPDQALLHQLVWLNALAHGVPHSAPAEVMGALSTAHDRLRSAQPVLSMAKRFLPQAFVLLSWNTMIKGLGIRTIDIPILSGGDLLLSGHKHRLPGRAGSLLVGAALQMPVEELAREEKRRLAVRLRELGVSDYVNLGDIIRQAEQLHSRYRISGDRDISETWRAVMQYATSLLSADAQRVLAMYP